jgi:4,5-DOPA dioxygenase extradiol
MPAASFGHGNPMNALEINRYTRRGARSGSLCPRADASISVV